MADQPKTQDLQQIRDILFGEQALQFEARIEKLEQSIIALRREREDAVNTLRRERTDAISNLRQEHDSDVNDLRRENRNLRHALEVEAMARTAHDERLLADMTARRNALVENLTQLLQDHLLREKEARAQQSQLLHDTVEAYRQAQDELTTQLIAHLQARQEETDRRFAALQAALDTQRRSRDDVAHLLSAELAHFQSSHVIPQPGDNGTAPQKEKESEAASQADS